MITIAAYGVAVRLESADPRLVDAIRRDFSPFVVTGEAPPPQVTLRAASTRPPWELAPDARCVMVQPHCVVYDHGGERWVDYQGQGLCRWSVDRDEAELWSEDFDLLYEITYLFILSRMGELHDQRGLHRVHALGLAVGGQGVLCLLPSGGGKTTLGLGALRLPGVKLLSDDHPLLDQRGHLLAFPNRLGTVGPPPADIDPRFVRTFHRREHGMKHLVDVEAFADRLGSDAPLRVILLGERRLAGPALIEPMAAGPVAAELFRSVVVGVGLPQVVEYFLRFDLADYARKARLVASRTRACTRVLRSVQVLRFRLGRDRAENLSVFQALLGSLGAEE